MSASTWSPIQPLDQGVIKYDFSEIGSLQQRWVEAKEHMESSVPKAYEEFLRSLTRRWAIETGMLEGLYALDRGVTEVLIRRGITAELIEPSSTDIEPVQLVTILKDHEKAIQLVHQWIREERPLSKSLIRMLHSTLAASQPSYHTVDQFGNPFQAELHKGGFKKVPNNPTRPDGSVHEYCPPEQVDSEIDRLLQWHCEYITADINPILVSAWLHHRFSQIHPFEDGNGRVARALVTWQLARDQFLPIVVSRDDRDTYIAALEQADAGDPLQLIDLFVRLEKTSILQALSADTSQTVVGSKGIDQVVDSIVDRVERRRKSQLEHMLSVNEVAVQLRGQAHVMLDERATDLAGQLKKKAEIDIEHWIELGGPDEGNEYYYRAQVTETAKGDWVNFNENRYFLKLSISPRPQKRPRVVFVVSLHHVGRDVSGGMAATAFAEIEYYEEDAQPSSIASSIDCTLSPFTFGWNDDPDALAPRFREWVEECFSIALRHWGDIL